MAGGFAQPPKQVMLIHVHFRIGQQGLVSPRGNPLITDGYPSDLLFQESKVTRSKGDRCNMEADTEPLILLLTTEVKCPNHRTASSVIGYTFLRAPNCLLAPAGASRRLMCAVLRGLFLAFLIL